MVTASFNFPHPKLLAKLCLPIPRVEVIYGHNKYIVGPGLTESTANYSFIWETIGPWSFPLPTFHSGRFTNTRPEYITVCLLACLSLFSWDSISQREVNWDWHLAQSFSCCQSGFGIADQTNWTDGKRLNSYIFPLLIWVQSSVRKKISVPNRSVGLDDKLGAEWHGKHTSRSRGSLTTGLTMPLAIARIQKIHRKSTNNPLTPFPPHIWQYIILFQSINLSLFPSEKSIKFGRRLGLGRVICPRSGRRCPVISTRFSTSFSIMEDNPVSCWKGKFIIIKNVNSVSGH